MTTKPPESFLPLTPSTFYILLVLAGGEMHGYGIMQAVDEQTDGEIKIGPGTLYTNIKRLLELGWIVETASNPQEDERRRYYRLTDFGNKVARAEALRLKRVVQSARQFGLLEGES